MKKTTPKRVTRAELERAVLAYDRAEHAWMYGGPPANYTRLDWNKRNLARLASRIRAGRKGKKG